MCLDSKLQTMQKIQEKKKIILQFGIYLNVSIDHSMLVVCSIKNKVIQNNSKIFVAKTVIIQQCRRIVKSNILM
jgi:hypothetical protein